MERSNYWNDWKCYLSVQLRFDCRYVYCLSIVICFYLLRSEVAIGSLFFQIQLSLSDLTVYIKKAVLKLYFFFKGETASKVIYTKYSKHWPHTVAHTIDCVCSKMLNHVLNHELFLSLFKFFGWKYILNWIN